MRTAIDIVLELVRDDKITTTDAKVILEEINKPPQVVTVPYSTGITTTPGTTTTPDWTYDPNRTGTPQYTTNVGTTTDTTNK